MTEIICTLITALGTLACSYVAVAQRRQTKLAEQRVMEGRLQLQMIAANNALTVGVAEALKQGHTNGEVEEGLAAVEKAQKEYRIFLENAAIDQIRG